MLRTLFVLVVLVIIVLVGLALGQRLDHDPVTVDARTSPALVASPSPSEHRVDLLGPKFLELVRAMKPKPRARARTAPMHRLVAAAGIWDAIAQCESGGRWDDTRGGYEGGLHFAHDTWVRAGGRRFAEHAYQATRAQQIEIAIGWLARTSWAQWPVCSIRAGAR